MMPYTVVWTIGNDTPAIKEQKSKQARWMCLQQDMPSGLLSYSIEKNANPIEI